MDCIIQARMSSTRLPGKVLMKIENEKTVLEFVLNQCKESKLLDRMIIATTNKIDDQEIVKVVKKLGFDYFCGNESDVLDRYYKCAKKFKSKHIMRITSDCPLIDPTVIDRVIKKYQSGKFDYVSTSPPQTFPWGISVEIFSFKALKNIWKNAKIPSEREHVTPYFYKNPKKFKIFVVKNKIQLTNIRISVDRKNDLTLVRKVISKIKIRPILLKSILKLSKSNPDLFKINKSNIPNEGYLNSLKLDENCC